MCVKAILVFSITVNMTFLWFEMNSFYRHWGNEIFAFLPIFVIISVGLILASILSFKIRNVHFKAVAEDFHGFLRRTHPIAPAMVSLGFNKVA